MIIRSLFFVFTLIFLSAQTKDVYAALSCTFEPEMGQALEVLAHLDDSYKKNTIKDKALQINGFIRTGIYEGDFKGKGILKLSGLRYGKPANDNEKCLMYKAIIHTASQALTPQSRQTAAESIKKLIREGKSEDAKHQLTALIVSTLAQSQQTVRSYAVVKNTKEILGKDLIVPINIIWNSLPFKRANDIIEQERSAAIKEGLQHEANGKVAKSADQIQAYKQAAKSYQSAAAQGYSQARYLLGALYAKGFGLRSHEEEAAVSLLTKAAEQGVNEAASILEKIADKGNARASFALKTMYAQGILAAPDRTIALKWLQKAAEQNHAQAQFELAILYAKEGALKNEELAVKWLNKAAKNKHKKALEKIKAGHQIANVVARKFDTEFDAEFDTKSDRTESSNETSDTIVLNSLKGEPFESDTMRFTDPIDDPLKDNEPAFED